MLRSIQVWPASKIETEIKEGRVNFDFALQRSFIWEKDVHRKSLLIHSLIEDYPIPPLHLAQRDQRNYDGLDGKQRTSTITTFFDDKWKLGSDFTVTDDTGKEYDFSGMKFSELPEWARNRIKNYTFQIIFLQDLTEEQLHEMFYRLNNGKPLTGIELMRARAQSLVKFQQIAKHDFITSTTSPHGKKIFADEMLVMQIWAAMYALDGNKQLSFETKTFRPFISKAIVTPIEIKEICEILTIVENIYNSLATTSKREKRMQTKLKTRIHLVCLCKCIKEALAKACTVTEIAAWSKVFFSTPDGNPSVVAEYNASSGGGANNTAARKNFDKRYRAMSGHMESFIAKQAEEEKSTEKAKPGQPADWIKPQVDRILNGKKTAESGKKTASTADTKAKAVKK